MSSFTTPRGCKLGVPTGGQRKRNKTYTDREGTKLSVFTDDIDVYVEHHEELQENKNKNKNITLLEVISKHSKVTGYKVNISNIGIPWRYYGFGWLYTTAMK